jgi:hypothetical protein
MCALVICVAAATLGIDVGWERLPDGGMEYIIQLDPQTLESLRTGQAIQSDIPPSAGEVRSYRIMVGGKKLPRETPPTPKKLTPDPLVKPLPERPAVFVDPAGQTSPPTSDIAVKPWLPLTLALLGLFASLGTNIYLGWIAWDLYKCRRAPRSAIQPSASADG